MTKQELIEELKKLQQSDDPEVAHMEADNLLLEFIDDDEEVSEAFNSIEMWYA